MHLILSTVSIPKMLIQALKKIYLETLLKYILKKLFLNKTIITTYKKIQIISREKDKAL